MPGSRRPTQRSASQKAPSQSKFTDNGDLPGLIPGEAAEMTIQQERDALRARSKNPGQNGQETTFVVKSWRVDKALEALSNWKVQVQGYSDLAFFLFFFIIYVTLNILQLNPADSYTNNSMLRTVVGPSTLTGYRGVKNVEDFFSYSTVLLSTIFRNQWYSGEPIAVSDQGFLNFYNKIVGGVLFVQERGLQGDCPTGIYRTFYGNCHLDTRSTDVFVGSKNTMNFTYDEDQGGHTLFFSVAQKLADVTTSLALAKSNRFIDKNTQSVTIKFATYNGELEMFSFVVIKFNMDNGGVFTGDNAVTVQSARMELYKSHDDYVRFGLEIVFLYLTAWIITDELEDVFFTVVNEGIAVYLASFWNYLDLANIALVVLYIYFRAAYVAFVFDNPITLPANTYIATLEVVASWQQKLLTVNVFNIFIKIIHLFKHFGFQPRMNIINKTIENAIIDLGHFFILFFVIFLSYSAMALILFGPHLLNYSTIGRVIQTLGEMLLGQVAFQEIREIDGFLASVVMWSYQILVFYVMINVFLAIIIDAYADAKEKSADSAGLHNDLFFWFKKMQVQQPWKKQSTPTHLMPLFTTLEYFQNRIEQGHLKERVTNRELRMHMEMHLGMTPEEVTAQLSIMNQLPGKEYDAENPEVDMETLLKSAWAVYDVDGSGDLDADEFYHFIQEAPIKLTETEAEELLRKTDTNQDGMISFEEFTPVFHSVMLNSLKDGSREKNIARKALADGAKANLATLGIGEENFNKIHRVLSVDKHSSPVPIPHTKSGVFSHDVYGGGVSDPYEIEMGVKPSGGIPRLGPSLTDPTEYTPWTIAPVDNGQFLPGGSGYHNNNNGENNNNNNSVSWDSNGFVMPVLDEYSGSSGTDEHHSQPGF